MSKIRSVKEVNEELIAKQTVLHDIFVEAKNEAGKLEMTDEQLEDVQAKNEELNDLGVELEKSREVDGIFKKTQAAIREQAMPAGSLPMPQGIGDNPRQNDHMSQPQKVVKSIGELFTDSDQYKNWNPGQSAFLELKDYDPQMMYKTTMTTVAGFAPEVLRTGRVVDFATRRPMVADLIPQTTTTQNAVKYMEETTFTNATAAVAEGGTLPESALAYTERTQAIEKIGTWLPATDEQMEDVPQVQSLINNRLTLMLQLTEETQLLTGSGVTPNLTGFYNKAGIQTQAKGVDPVPDAIYKAMTLVRHTGFADPTGVVLHPNDWQDIRLLRTADGMYIWGNPSESGVERIWGIPTIITSAATENTGLVGDYQLFSEIFRRTGVTIQRTNSHASNFTADIQAVKIRERLALVIYRAAAFCTVTGI